MPLFIHSIKIQDGGGKVEAVAWPARPPAPKHPSLHPLPTCPPPPPSTAPRACPAAAAQWRAQRWPYSAEPPRACAPAQQNGSRPGSWPGPTPGTSRTACGTWARRAGEQGEGRGWGGGGSQGGRARVGRCGGGALAGGRSQGWGEGGSQEGEGEGGGGGGQAAKSYGWRVHARHIHPQTHMRAPTPTRTERHAHGCMQGEKHMRRHTRRAWTDR